MGGGVGGVGVVDPNRHIVLVVQGSERASLCSVVVVVGVVGEGVEVRRRGKLCYVCTPQRPTPTPPVCFPLKERKKDRNEICKNVASSGQHETGACLFQDEPRQGSGVSGWGRGGGCSAPVVELLLNRQRKSLQPASCQVAIAAPCCYLCWRV